MPESSRPAVPVFPWYDARSARGRLFAGFALGVLTVIATEDFSWTTRIVAGWDAAAVSLLGFLWWIIGKADPAETRRRAGSEDPGRTVVWAIVLLSSVFSLFAGSVVLRRARQLAPGAEPALVALSLIAVASAWLLTHSAYTLRYARLYYREDDREGVGGLEFPGERPPADIDFAYFAFTVGMCFQVSDVTISSPIIRRDVLVHAVISFAYNTAILSLALNLAFGLLG